MKSQQDAEDWLVQSLDVSRETLDRLTEYAELIRKWNKTINLVSQSSLKDLWVRHFLDSAQLLLNTPKNAQKWLDLGSGGGFPAVICAAITRQTRPELHYTCVESDRRKCAFLSTLKRELDLNLTVKPLRAEHLPDEKVDILTARAFTDLTALLHYGHHLKPTGRAIFLKGETHGKEIESALAQWNFSYQTHPSITHPDAAVLCIEGISRV